MKRSAALFFIGCVACSSDPADSGPPPCGSGVDRNDALAQKAARYDRQFHGLNAHVTGLTTDVRMAATGTAAQMLDAYVQGNVSSLDTQVIDSVDVWAKSPGLYSGVALAADAFRYGTLRDEGASCESIEDARQAVLRGLDGMHIAVDITGTPGVIARAIARTDIAGSGQRQTTPLFDANGNPLPEEKNNGTWRDDNSGNYPNYIWEDSCSRDMLVGWVMAFAAVAEVIRDDPTFDDMRKQRLAADALAMATRLREVNPTTGFDLEIPDADGRTTFHGYLNETALERGYIDGFENGFHAIMALGIVAGLAEAAEDQGIDRYLAEELIGQRRLHDISRRELEIVNLGVASNHSGFNMAFTAAWLAVRYVDRRIEAAGLAPAAGSTLRIALRDSLYAPDGQEYQPADMGQALYDSIVGDQIDDVTDAREKAHAVLQAFPEAPNRGKDRVNCDASEIASGQCTLDDGTSVRLLGEVGRNGKLVSSTPVPMAVRPSSNYYWRSNPYQVNGGQGASDISSGADFRVAYWLDRWAHRQPPN